MTSQRRHPSIRLMLLFSIAAVTVVVACVAKPVDWSQPRQVTEPSNHDVDDAPSWLTNDRIIFSRMNTGLMSMNADGSDLKQIPNSHLGAFDPSVSPDGTKIAFQQDGDLVVMNADGSSPRRLTSAKEREGCPRWSPDGKMIVYCVERGGSSELYTIDTETGQSLQLTDSAYTAYVGAWEPNGERIAFVDAEGHQIYLVSARGGSPVRVTADRMVKDYGLTWSRDGRWIVYGAASGDENTPDGLYAIHPDGTGAQLLFKSEIPWNPSFSPDGVWVAFSKQMQIEGAPRGTIYVMKVGDLLK